MPVVCTPEFVKVGSRFDKIEFPVKRPQLRPVCLLREKPVVFVSNFFCLFDFMFSA